MTKRSRSRRVTEMERLLYATRLRIAQGDVGASTTGLCDMISQAAKGIDWRSMDTSLLDEGWEGFDALSEDLEEFAGQMVSQLPRAQKLRRPHGR